MRPTSTPNDTESQNTSTSRFSAYMFTRNVLQYVFAIVLASMYIWYSQLLRTSSECTSDSLKSYTTASLILMAVHLAMFFLQLLVSTYAFVAKMYQEFSAILSLSALLWSPFLTILHFIFFIFGAASLTLDKNCSGYPIWIFAIFSTTMYGLAAISGL